MRSIRSRTGTARVTRACLVLLVCLAMAVSGAAHGATSQAVVTMTVPGATEILNPNCQTGQPGRTSFGVLLPGTATVSGADCNVTFGATTGSSMLRLAQTDGFGTAMARQGFAPRVSGTVEVLQSTSFGSGSRAWASGYNGVIRVSNDGGVTWSAQASGTGNDLLEVDAVSPTVAWAAGEAAGVRRTLDGGATAWQNVGVPLGGVTTIRSLDALDSQRAWVAGDGGFVRRTADGGATWTNINIPVANDVLDIEVLNDTDVWVGGTNVLYRSSNGGTSWTPVTVPGGSELRTVAPVDINTIWVGGSSETVWKTTNGGTSWTPQWNIAGNNINDIHALDANTAWFVASPATPGVWGTTDGGATWNKVHTGSSQLYELDLVDSGRIVASGAAGAIHSSPVDPVSDYSDPGNTDWATPGAQLFGACLRDVSSGAATDGGSWVADSATTGDEAAAVADCGDGDADPWQPVPTTAAKVAMTGTGATPAVATAHLRFGFRSSVTQPAGTYVAPVTFEVVAPNI